MFPYLLLTGMLFGDFSGHQCVVPQNALHPQAWADCIVPTLSGSEITVISTDNKFEVHYTMSGVDAVDPNDATANGIPDYIDYIFEGLAESYSKQIVTMGWKLPIPLTQEKKVSVYVTNLAEGALGFAFNECLWITNNLNIFPYSVVYPLSVKAIVAHEFNHLLQAAYTYTSGNYEFWWGEATAMWAEYKTSPLLTEYPGILLYNLEGAFKKIYDPFKTPNNILWPLYLEEGNGKNEKIIREIWEWLETHSGQFATDAIDDVLKGYPDGSFKKAFQNYSEWNTFLGKRDDGMHYSIAHLVTTDYFGNLKFEATHKSLPASGGPENPPVLYGISYIELIPSQTMKGAKFKFEGNINIDWSISMLLFKSNGVDKVVKENVKNKTEIAVADVTRYNDIIIVIRNMGPENLIGYYSYWLSPYEEPPGCGCHLANVPMGQVIGNSLLIFIVLVYIKIHAQRKRATPPTRSTLRRRPA